jgi:hypothetical protein
VLLSSGSVLSLNQLELRFNRTRRELGTLEQFPQPRVLFLQFRCIHKTSNHNQSKTFQAVFEKQHLCKKKHSAS